MRDGAMETAKMRLKHIANKQKGGGDRARNANKATEPTETQGDCILFYFIVLFYGSIEPPKNVIF